MKEYKINLSVIVESEESDIERVKDFFQDLAENDMLDENFNSDDDIKIIEVEITDAIDLNDYDTDIDYSDMDDEDEE